MITLDDLRTEYIKTFNIAVPARFKNNAEWIKARIDAHKKDKEEEVLLKKVEISPTPTDLNPLRITIKGEYTKNGYDIVTDGTVWKVVPAGGDFWTSQAIYVGDKKGAELVFKGMYK